MDPLSIAGTAVGLCKASYEISKSLYHFADKTLNVDNHLKDFAREVENVSRILKAVTSTINDPRLRLNQISKGPNANQDVWEALMGPISDLKLYFNALKAKLDGVSAKGNDGNIFWQAIRAFELSLAENNLDNLRSHLFNHQLSLNTAFQMIQLYAHANLPAAEQPDLRPEISRLIKTVRRLPSDRRRQGAQGDSVSSEDTSGSATRLRKAAIKVASHASVYAESTTGSEYGAPLDASHAGRIEDWLALADVSEHSEAFPDFSHAGMSHSNLSGGFSSLTTAIEMDSLRTGEPDLPLQSSQLKNTANTASMPPSSSFSTSGSPKTTAIQVTDLGESSEWPSSHPQDLYTSPQSKISTQLHYLVCLLLITQFLLCIAEPVLLMWVADSHSINALLSISTAFISMAYILARSGVALARTRTIKLRYSARIMWWHIIPEILLFILWVSAFAYSGSRWFRTLQFPDPDQFLKGLLAATWISLIIALASLATFVIDLALWRKDRRSEV